MHGDRAGRPVAAGAGGRIGRRGSRATRAHVRPPCARRRWRAAEGPQGARRTSPGRAPKAAKRRATGGASPCGWMRVDVDRRVAPALSGHRVPVRCLAYIRRSSSIYRCAATAGVPRSEIERDNARGNNTAQRATPSAARNLNARRTAVCGMRTDICSLQPCCAAR